jgi:hypothetical protein
VSETRSGKRTLRKKSAACRSRNHQHITSVCGARSAH